MGWGYCGAKPYGFAPLATRYYLLYTERIMTPLGIQRTVAVLLILFPWLYVPTAFKEVAIVIAGILLYISTLDMRKKHKDESVKVAQDEHSLVS